MFGGLLFSLCSLNFLDVIFKESNVPLQIINQVLIPLYDFLLACYLLSSMIPLFLMRLAVGMLQPNIWAIPAMP